MILPKSILEVTIPKSLERISIGQSQAEVFKVQLQNQEWAYLKISSSRYVVDEIYREIEVLHWLKARLPVPTFLAVTEDFGKIHFLVSTLPGENLATASQNLTAREILIAGARFLRQWHSLPVSDCPFDRRLPVTLPLAMEHGEADLVDETDFDAERSGKTAREVYAELLENVPESEDVVFTHGDFCLPNLIVDHGEISGAVDLGRAGMADRYQDIALFLRSYRSNVAQPDLDLFLEEYQFIQELDFKKLSFYRTLDEFF